MENKLLSTLLIALSFTYCQAQKPFDVNKPYKGFIVKNDVEIYVDDKKNWYEPTVEEISEVESMIQAEIESINKDRPNQTGDCPVIDKNLKKYLRQYIGYINQDNEKIILVNMIWMKNADLDGLDKEYAMILDGCSYYWRIKANLNTNKLFDFDVNGSA